MPDQPAANTLYFGDNLHVLREHITSDSVDLIYLDPPFNSNRAYNVLFQDESGHDSEAQIMAFGDTWHWDHGAELTYADLLNNAPPTVSAMISSLRQFVGANQMMAYLVMMAARLLELHRILKPTGSLYLHCDPTASHYLKIILDVIFGADNFQNEINWKRKHGRTGPIRRFGTACDIILFYTKSQNYTFHTQYGENDPEYLEKMFRYVDEHGRRYRIDNLASPNPRPNLMYEYKGYKPPAKGWAISKEKMEEWDRLGKLHFPKSIDGRIQRKRYLDELKGEEIQSLWDDILPIGSQAAERLGYPTQKPLTLLERIINASSNPGDVILDPFCGCGTAIAAAQGLGRQWIGIDITYLAISLIRTRIKDMYPDAAYNVIGMPEDLQSARQLAQLSDHDGRYQFQFWSLSMIAAKPLGAEAGSKKGKKGSDRGIDGVIPFVDDSSARRKQILVQVKSGHVKSGDVRDLRGVLDREKAEMGVFITLEPSTSEMQREAATAGFYHSPNWNRDYPRLQILTIEELLAGAEVKMPPVRGMAFKRAARADGPESEQLDLEL